MIPVIPESPVFGPRPLRVKPILGMVPVTGVDVYKVLCAGFFLIKFHYLSFFFSIWPGLIQQSPGLQVPRSLLMYFGCRETGLSEEWVA